MKYLPSRCPRIARTPLACAIAASLVALLNPSIGSAAATDYFWSALGAGDGGTASGGTGTWDTTSSLWRNNTNTGTLGTYNSVNTSRAQFAGTAGVVTLGSNITANALLFSTTGYTVNGDANNSFKLTLAGTLPSIAVASGNTAVVNAIIAGTAGLNKQNQGGGGDGGGTLILGGANTYSGTTYIQQGTVRVSSIGSTSSTSSGFGSTGATVKLGGFTNGAGVTYTGVGESTNRTFDQAGAGASSTLSNLGSGLLTITSNITSSNSTDTGTTANNTLTLTGNITATGNVQNNSATKKTIVNTASGTITLSGATTFTGGVSVRNGGTLVLDYANNATILDSTNTVTLGNGSGGSIGGTFYIKGKSTGTTSQTLGNLSFYDGSNSVVVDNNGGSGTTLNLGTLTRNATKSSTILFDFTSGGAVTANVTSTTDGLLNGSSGYLVRTASTVDFAGASGIGAGQTIGAVGSTTDLVSSGGSTNTNYLLSGDKSITANVTAGTVRVDTTVGAGKTLTIDSAKALTLGKNTLLFDGTGAFNIAGPGTLGTSGGNLIIQQYSTNASGVTIGANVILSTAPISKFGSGLLVNNSTSTALNGLNIFGGVYRAGTSAALSIGNIALATGGVLELTADLTTRTIGTGTTAVQFVGGSDGGFSASGGTRAVNFGATPISWGATSFVGNGNRLILGSIYSDSTVDFQTGLDFGGVYREVRVDNGSAAVDAKLSGVLSSTVGALTVPGGLVKSGAGTLQLTGANTYTGTTTVSAGTLQVGNLTALYNNTAANWVPAKITIANGATLAVNVGGAGEFGSTELTTLLDGSHLGTATASTGFQSGSSVGIDTSNASGTFTYSTALNDTVGTVNAVGLTKLGTGTLELGNASNNYTGPTKVNAGTLLVSGSISASTSVDVNGGGTLLLGGVSTDRIKDSAAVSLGAGATPGTGGILKTGGLSEGPAGGAGGNNAAMGALTLSSNSTIDFATGALGSNLLFSSLTYTSGDAVRILNWSGSLGMDDGSAGNDRLLFVGDPGFSTAQLSGFQFYNDSGVALGTGATQISFHGYTELVPVPEPNALWIGGAGLVLVGWRERRRFRRGIGGFLAGSAGADPTLPSASTGTDGSERSFETSAP